MKAWVDGRFVDWREVTVSPLAHCFGRGVIVFEVLTIFNTRFGPAFFCLMEHVDRFFRSAGLVHMKPALSSDDLCSALMAAARENRVSAGICKVFGYFPSTELSVVPKDPRVSVAIFCADYDFFGFDQEKFSLPFSMKVSTYRKVHPDDLQVQAKVTGYYVGAYLGSVEMAGQGLGEPLFLDSSGYVCEGGTYNVFLIRNGIIRTPSLKRVLAGTTRNVVIQVARDLGFTVVEQDIRSGELDQFDEAFCAGTLKKIAPIESIDGRRLGTSCPGPITSAVIDAMDLVYRGESDKHLTWLTPIG